MAAPSPVVRRWWWTTISLRPSCVQPRLLRFLTRASRREVALRKTSNRIESNSFLGFFFFSFSTRVKKFPRLNGGALIITPLPPPPCLLGTERSVSRFFRSRDTASREIGKRPRDGGKETEKGNKNKRKTGCSVKTRGPK